MKLCWSTGLAPGPEPRCERFKTLTIPTSRSLVNLMGLFSKIPHMNLKMGSVEQSFVGSIDQGTTSSRFLIFNKDGEPVVSHQLEFKQIYPQPGYGELRLSFG